MSIIIKLVCLVCVVVACSVTGVNAGIGYAVMVPQAIGADSEWMAVAESLMEKYPDTKLFVYAKTPFDVLDDLKVQDPGYMALVLPPDMIDAMTVATMHRLSRQLDDDPYGDALWGIITGYSASDAMRIVKMSEPLKIRSGFGTTGFSTAAMVNILNISDSKRGDLFTKEDGGDGVKTEHDPQSAKGLTYMLQDFWRDKNPELFVTSGHATQYNLEMSWGQGLITCHSNRFYALRRDQINGFARFLSGVIFNGSEEDVANYVTKCNASALDISESPKVWVGAGNCLLGDVKKSRNTMAITALSAGGFNQLVGYTVPTWFGRMGWGTLGKFQSAQHMTLAEAFFMSNQALLEESEQRYPGMLELEVDPDGDFSKKISSEKFKSSIAATGLKTVDKDCLGLLHDRDTVAFFGDPRWEARMPGDASIKVVQKSVADGIELHITTSDNFKPNSGFDLIFPASLPCTTALPCHVRSERRRKSGLDRNDPTWRPDLRKTVLPPTHATDATSQSGSPTVSRPQLRSDLQRRRCSSFSGADGWDLLLTDDFLLVKKSDLQPSESRVVKILFGKS